MTQGDEIPIDHLLTKVWTRYHLEFPRLQQQVDGDDSEVDFVSLPRWELGEHLMGLLVLDEDDSVSGVSGEMIEAWGGDAAQLCGEAELRTAGLVGVWGIMDAEDGGPGRLIIPDIDEAYASSAFLCTAAFEGFGLADGALACAPTRGSFFMLEPGSLKLETAFLEEIEKATEEEGHPLCPVPLEWREGRWHAWTAPPDHPLGSRYRNLERVFLHHVYEEQKELLDRLHGARRESVFVATHVLHEVEGQADYVSRAVWSRGVDSLLPRVDRIGFVDLKADPPIRLQVDWADAVRITGHLMEEVPGMHPPRYAVRAFPDDGALGALRDLGEQL